MNQNEDDKPYRHQRGMTKTEIHYHEGSDEGPAKDKNLVDVVGPHGRTMN